jgi:hypothetical protein
MSKVYNLFWDETMLLALGLAVYSIYRVWPQIVSGLL